MILTHNLTFFSNAGLLQFEAELLLLALEPVDGEPGVSQLLGQDLGRRLGVDAQHRVQLAAQVLRLLRVRALAVRGAPQQSLYLGQEVRLALQIGLQL